MNDATLKILEDAANDEEIIDIIHQKYAKKEDDELALLVNKARKNNTYLMRDILRNVIYDYVEYQPMAIGNCHRKRKENSKLTFRYDYKLSINNLSKKIMLLANRYNRGKGTNECIYLFEHKYDSNTPVIIDIKKIRHFYNLFTEAMITNKYIELHVDIETLKELTEQAYYGKLKEDGDIIDKSIIERLKDAYLKIYMKEKKLTDYLDEIRPNAEIVYQNNVKNLIINYKKNPHFRSYEIEIEHLNPSYNSIEMTIIKEYNDTAIIESDDSICFAKYIKEKGKEEYLPFQISELEKKIKEDEQLLNGSLRKYDYIHYPYCYISIYYDGDNLEKLLADNYKHSLIKKHKK